MLFLIILTFNNKCFKFYVTPIPTLILILLCPSLIRFFQFQLLSPLLFFFLFLSVPIQIFNFILYSEDYAINFSTLSSYLSSSFLYLPLIPYFSFLILTIGFIIVLITIKAFISVSIIVGNSIDVYPPGIIAVLIN